MSDLDTLTFDLGNSFLKLLRWAPAPSAALRVSWEDDWARDAMSWLDAQATSPSSIAISSVVDSLRLTELVKLCELRGHGVRLHPQPELDVDCLEPESVGKDRLYAALGAWDLEAAPAIVLDAGTALTVDALAVREGRPCFLGGAIAPGPQLLARALSKGGSQLFYTDPDGPDMRGEIPALGRDTRSALRAGIVVGFQGAACELVQRIAAEVGLNEARLVVTGGARSFLLRATSGAQPLFGDREVVEAEHLVHHGLRRCMLPNPS